MNVSFNSQRGKKNKKVGIQLEMDKMESEYRDEIERSQSFITFLYLFRNVVAHWNPSRNKSIHYSGSYDRPEGLMLPLSGELADKARIVLNSKIELVDHAIIGDKDIVVDPLVMSWVIINELARIARAVLNDCARRLELSVHHRHDDSKGDFFSKLEKASIPIMGTWNMPSSLF